MDVGSPASADGPTNGSKTKPRKDSIWQLTTKW